MLKMSPLSDNDLRGVSGGKQGKTYRRYVLGEGETLADAAARFHTTETELMRVNSIKDFQVKRLRKGDIIMIPVEP